ncbi:hypothetical protein FSARC_6252 [Fusarium sarcochroum]|uniref:Uncharacterized protein n=1 Tax=Fusarium sarcochroum TaxID=1208366 RepID=A0A8H4TXV1_9HYPO|nr:hypothetical protein FSARC_6252 [Fusarium sarcochroum]
MFSLGIRVSGLAITVLPGQKSPAGAVPLTQPKMEDEQIKGEIGTIEESPDLYWKPGRLLGPDDQARALISQSQTFSMLSPAFAPLSEIDPNLLSATCRSHMAQYMRPRGVGVGWGDFDRFHEWQLFGRCVEKSMVERKEWRWPNAPNVTFTSEATDQVYVVPTDCARLEAPKAANDLTTLWKQVNNKNNKKPPSDPSELV